MFLVSFWERYPALLYALTALIGTSLGFSLQLSLGMLLLIILIPFYKDWKKLFLLAGIAISSFLYVHIEYQFPSVPKQGLRGIAHFEISSIASKKTSYGAQWSYLGNIRTFKEYRNIPCVISIPKKEDITRPPANQAYMIKGLLKQNVKGSYYFLVDKKAVWKPVPKSWSLAEIRYHAKNTVTAYIKQNISDKKAADFLSGLATGSFEDPLMFNEFARFGLQHIMAISGFHFAIIASILALILRFFVKEKLSTPLLILLISSYFFFLGDSPSIIRAWITILVSLVAISLERRSSGLNSLGVAILFILIYDPQMTRTVGFQFSALSTAAILLFYPLFDQMLRQIVQVRPLSQMIQMPTVDQHGYLVLATFRQACALALAVNIVALPATLFYFQKFPYLSLLFNLFFPFLVSISMLLLIIGLILGPLGCLIHASNTIYTQFTLNFLYGIPSNFDYALQVTSLPDPFLILYLSVVFYLGILFTHRSRERILCFD
jgi:competence protein ComEC